MKYLLNVAMVVTASLALMMSGMDVAEAGKRFGGGASFGGKFSQNKSVKKNDSSKDSMQRQKATPAQQKNADRKQQLASKGGMMGMLGALAIGGLLGAMFFGGGFENINFMDILIFGGIAFLLFKLFASRAARSRPQQAAAGGYDAPTDMDKNDHIQERAITPDYFGGGNNNDAASDEGQTIDDLRGGNLPKQFDEADFLDGAKNCFARLQRAWDEGDLADIRQFTCDSVFAEIQDQFQARDSHDKTEIIELEAELLNATDLGSKQEAIVLFKAELTEEGNTHTVEEVWHFVKANTSHQPSWQVDGIQQVEG